MGLYLRKSIRVGPLRFNLSGSGVGVSVGVKGLRVGTGPRGNYVHMGRHGLYYRATIPQSRPGQGPIPSAPAPQIPGGTHEPLNDIESAAAAQIVDSSSAELLREINEKRRKIRLWPLALTSALILLVLALFAGWPRWLVVAIPILGVAAIYFAHRRDVLARTVVLFYDLDAEMEKAYGALHQAAEQLSGCTRIWHVEAQGRVADRKYHAGASDLLRRKPTFIKAAEPPSQDQCSDDQCWSRSPSPALLSRSRACLRRRRRWRRWLQGTSA